MDGFRRMGNEGKEQKPWNPGNVSMPTSLTRKADSERKRQSAVNQGKGQQPRTPGIVSMPTRLTRRTRYSHFTLIICTDVGRVSVA
jgi:hypothetical protein